jgi:hypothetical protein
VQDPDRVSANSTDECATQGNALPESVEAGTESSNEADYTAQWQRRGEAQAHDAEKAAGKEGEQLTIFFVDVVDARGWRQLAVQRERWLCRQRNLPTRSHKFCRKHQRKRQYCKPQEIVETAKGSVAVEDPQGVKTAAAATTPAISTAAWKPYSTQTHQLNKATHFFTDQRRQRSGADAGVPTLQRWLL